MKLLFIGTGSGITSLNRFHTSLLIEHNGKELLIDSGDGFSKAFLSLNLSFTENIDFIFITHFHSDHVSGLPSLLVQMKLAKRVKDLKIFVHRELKTTLIKMLAAVYVFLENLNFNAEIICFDFTDIKLSENFGISVRKNGHIKPKQNITVFDKINFVSVSLKIGCGNQNIVFTSDLGDKNDLLLFNESNCDFLISEFTHISTEELVESFNVLNAKKIILTHLDDKDLEKIYDNKLIKQKISEGNLLVAYDGMSIAE